MWVPIRLMIEGDSVDAEVRVDLCLWIIIQPNFVDTDT